MRVSNLMQVSFPLLALMASAWIGMPAAWGQWNEPPLTAPAAETAQGESAAASRVEVYPVGDLLSFESGWQSVTLPGGGMVTTASLPGPGGSSPPPVYAPSASSSPYPSSYPPGPTPAPVYHAPVTTVPVAPAVDRLATIVREMAADTPIRVITHSETQSLIVRGSDAVHNDVRQLLNGLREASKPTVRVEVRRLFAGGTDRASLNLSDDQLERLGPLIHQEILSPSEVEFLVQADTSGMPSHTIELVPGRWVNRINALFAGRVAAAPSADGRSIRVGVEMLTKPDHFDRSLPPQSYQVPLGKSLLVQSSDGDRPTFLLLTPTLIEPEEEEPGTQDTLLRGVPYQAKRFRNVGHPRGVERGVPIESIDYSEIQINR